MPLDEKELERLAVNEMLSEAKRGAERAKVMGALGWQKCPLPTTNKVFLHNTLLSTLRTSPKVNMRRNNHKILTRKSPTSDSRDDSSSSKHSRDDTKKDSDESHHRVEEKRKQKHLKHSTKKPAKRKKVKKSQLLDAEDIAGGANKFKRKKTHTSKNKDEKQIRRNKHDKHKKKKHKHS